MRTAGKYAFFDHSPGSAHHMVLGLVAPGSRVLEFGCATGYMSRVMRQRLGCPRIVGVEYVAEAAELAQEHCDRVIAGDAESLDLPRDLAGEQFDAITFADVLEHLRDPAGLLRRLLPLLAAEGAVVASIPNIAHGSVRLALAAGEFRYRRTGLLDSTHLRFFTRQTVAELFQEAGYTVTWWLRRRAAIRGTEVGVPDVPQVVYDYVAADRDSWTYQFVVRAVPAARAGADAARTDLAAAHDDLLRCDDPWAEGLRRVAAEIRRTLASGTRFVLADEDQWRGTSDFAGFQPIPFTEAGNVYAGPPADDAAAVLFLRQHAARGLPLVLGWPAFWWLDYYPSLAGEFHCAWRELLRTDRVVIFLPQT